jgi:hypothetical protein
MGQGASRQSRTLVSLLSGKIPAKHRIGDARTYRKNNPINDIQNQTSGLGSGIFTAKSPLRNTLAAEQQGNLKDGISRLGKW